MNSESEVSGGEGAQRQQVEKAGGVTAAERYLGQLCSRTFLSLWSYPGVYRDQGKPLNGGDGKEICDLLVVFDRQIIIFSDKHCQLRRTGDPALDWRRWFRKAVQKSAEQAWGAERWLRQNPTRVFLDRKCQRRLPIELPSIEDASFHLVVVAHGISAHVRETFHGTGSLVIDTKTRGFDTHAVPFHVGDLEPHRSFVHVLDDDSLELLMAQRDTISDFIAYLSKREQLFRAKPSILATGEEELLAIYLRNLNDAGDHDFIFPTPPGESCSDILILEGHWEAFGREPERLEQLRQDKVSYVWDKLIETFGHYALRGEQYFVTEGGIKDAEKVLRFMAREPRWKRRVLAQTLLEMLRITPAHARRMRVLSPVERGDPHYCFLLFPIPPGVAHPRYREVRRDFLAACCSVVRLEYPDARDIIGIATESGLDNHGRSEDALYLDGSHWTLDMEKAARDDKAKLGILISPTRFEEHVQEYPNIALRSELKNPRNKPCPCGSGRKYKHCCLKGVR